MNPYRSIAMILTVGALGGLAHCVVAADLPVAEANQVLYMKQEEKMARDVYRALSAKWDLPMLERIAASEQRHMDAVDRLIALHGLTDTTPAPAGSFSIPDLQKLHDDLVASGSQSLEKAVAAGVAIEQADIADLEEVLKTASSPAVKRVMANLLTASGHHLAAFEAAAERLAAGEAIGTCPLGNEACPGAGRGRGPGKGMGMGRNEACSMGAQGAACGGAGPGQGWGRGNGKGRGQGACLRAQDGTCQQAADGPQSGNAAGGLADGTGARKGNGRGAGGR